MAFKHWKKRLSLNLQAALGQSVKKKYVVIESDDWGGIRMPSPEVFRHLVKKGLPIQNDCFNRFDSLASEDDLTALFEVLNQHQDQSGNSPIFTFNVTTANPDFEKIEQSGFNEFIVEPFFDTVKNHRKGALELWKAGMKEGFIFPQYHGREHVHQKRWLEALKNQEPQILEAFKCGVYGIVPLNDKAEYFMAAYDYAPDAAFDDQKSSIEDGLNIFETFFGFTPKSFIPPCYIASERLLSCLSASGVPAVQGKIIGLEPLGTVNGVRSYKKRFRSAGFNQHTGRVNLVRNCFFEPASNQSYNWIADCLNRMEIIFKWNKPVVIDTHRVNYIGVIEESNRKQNLVLLNTLFKEMLKKWPDIEFVSSEQLVNHYIKTVYER